MPIKDESPATATPDIAYGTVWLVGADDGDPWRLSPLERHALATADAVIHDQEIAQSILDLAGPPSYREPAGRDQGLERAITLAKDGWRVVRLVAGDPAERAAEAAVAFAEAGVPLYAVSNTGQLVEAAIGLLLVSKQAFSAGADTSALAVLLPLTISAATIRGEPRRPPLSFSMSGLAG